ncbi:hypothetical protein COY28_00195 [Candidatus Woesearchaeota archaeon CG_4_10_14_0_2_um_filter_57_5]|nr:MAG: hypothetical protein AUJ68_02325 [Candidatus Woesearchaeota archaeon CG1_02_57_44]PIZ57354.1 MAG: hypothetical protein COY28_00195 [Candidatus Woesearchaeota archaeon CG_4_10_14_0_2_um_filter_57_5]
MPPACEPPFTRLPPPAWFISEKFILAVLPSGETVLAYNHESDLTSDFHAVIKDDLYTTRHYGGGYLHGRDRAMEQVLQWTQDECMRPVVVPYEADGVEYLGIEGIMDTLPDLDLVLVGASGDLGPFRPLVARDVLDAQKLTYALMLSERIETRYRRNGRRRSDWQTLRHLYVSGPETGAIATVDIAQANPKLDNHFWTLLER